jgi:hypothetical protein
MGRDQRFLPYISAGLLAALVLFVFWTLRHYGPESAIRRFHVAAALGDDRDLAQVSRQPPDSSNVVLLKNLVGNWLRGGGRYRLVRMERTPNRVLGHVAYVDPIGAPRNAMLWVVEKRPHGPWMVDADKTYNLLRRRLGL